MRTKDDLITLYLHDKLYKNKPTSENVKFEIAPNMLKNSTTLSLEDFATEIAVKGKVSVLCKFKEEQLKNGRYDTPKKDKEIISQELIMLDFDNTDDSAKEFTYSEALKDSFIQNNALFIYKTFNHSEEKNKFRVCFRLDRKVTSIVEIETIYQVLFNKFTQIDESCGQTSRLFYGSTKGYEVINWNNTINVDEIVSSFKALKINTKKVTTPSKQSQLSPSEKNIIDTYSIPDNDLVWKCLKDNKYYQAKKLIDNKIEQGLIPIANKTFYDRRTFKLQMINHLPMSVLLDLPFEKSFLDIFHDEQEPSANIFYGRAGNKQLYKCFSENYPFVGDIIDVVSKLTNKGFIETIDFIQELIHVTIEQDAELKLIKENTQDFIDLMMDIDIKDTAPHFYAMFGSSRAIVRDTLIVLLEQTYSDPKTFQKHYIQYMTLDSLRISVSAKLGLDEEHAITKSKMKRVINLMSLMDIIVKLPDVAIPKTLLQGLKTSRSLKNNKHRSDVYEIVKSFEDPKIRLMKADIKSKLARNKGIYLSNIDFDRIYTNLGKEDALKVFPQKTKDESKVSQILIDLEMFVAEKTSKSILDIGYVKEDALLLAICRKYKITKIDARSKFKKIENNLLEGYDLASVRLNKQYKELFNVTAIEKPYKIFLPKSSVIKK